MKETNLTKVCSTCGLGKMLNENNFFKRKSSKDGFRGQCKTCQRATRRKWQEKNVDYIKEYNRVNKEHIRENQKEYDKKYYIKNKEKINIKNRKNYHDNKKSYAEVKKEWRKNNSQYIKEQQKEWRKNNRDYIKKYGYQYREENKDYLNDQSRLWRQKNRHKDAAYSVKRRNLIKEVEKSLTIDEWNDILRDYDYSCAYCDMGQDEHLDKYRQRLHQDHVVPLTKGGSFTKENIVPACITCNASKSNKNLGEWLEEREYINDYIKK